MRLNLRAYFTVFSILVLTLILNMSKGLCTSNTSLLQEIHFLSANNQTKIRDIEENIVQLTQIQTARKDEQLKLIRLIDRRQELYLRHDFISRLSRHTDNNYQQQPKVSFLIQQLKLIAQNEEKSETPNKQFLNFIINCRQVLIDRPPEQHNPIELIERYMKFTKISKNKTSATFYKDSDYSNRSESYTAKEISIQDIGRLTDGVKTSTQQVIKNNKVINFYPDQSEQEFISKKIYLEQQLTNSSASLKQIQQPLIKTQTLDKTKLQKFMNQDDFQNLFSK